MNDHKKRVAEMLRRATQPIRMPHAAASDRLRDVQTENLEIVALPPVDTVEPQRVVERIFSDNRSRDLGMQGFEKAQRGLSLSNQESDILEAIILLDLRPCIDIQSNTFGTVPPEWSQLANFKPAIDQAIRAVGRIELPNLPSIPYGGTGFVVGPNLLLTNRHVAELFTSGIGQNNLTFRPYVGTCVDFHQEITSPPPAQLLKVRKTLMIHPHWDAALLQVDGLQGVPVMTLAANPPTALDGRPVAVIGYPMLDVRNDFAKQQEIFRGVFGKKRLSPGKLMGYKVVRSFGKGVEAIAHDSSTLGGNSGSLVLDLETDMVLGLHFAGKYMEANYAVPAWELANDNHLAHLNFGERTRPDGFVPPTWLNAWDKLNEQPQAAVPALTEPGQRTAVSDWFERTTNDELLEAYQRNHTGTQALLGQTLLPDEAASLVADLEAGQVVGETYLPSQEGLFGSRIDPDLPEIVFLHGITGCHLAGSGGLIDRIWLNPLAFLAGDLAEGLTLASDGRSDARRGSRLVTDGHIRYVYERASRTWRQQGFVVHPFSFDWRKGIAHGADRLHLFLEHLRRERPQGKPVVLVAHSMGGLVAALYAHRHSKWAERVGQAIFMGTPLRGSFAPVEAVLGTYPFLQKLARLSRLDDTMDLRRMASTLPGLLDMMPDPAQFTDAAPVYKSLFWPNHVVPQASFLKQSQKLKNQFANSPLLGLTTSIVSLAHGTVASLQAGGGAGAGPATGVGDGTVPGRSAVIAGRPNFKATTEHAKLPRDPAVIQAVSELIRTGTCALPPVTEADDLNATLPTTESLDPIPLEAAMLDCSAAIDAMRGRMQEGVFTQADYDWLVGS